MHRALTGYRPSDVAAALAAYRERLEALRLGRAERLAEADREVRAATEAVLVVEADLAAELARVRELLGELTSWNERVRQRVNEAKARFEAEEAAEWAALAALEARVVERRAVAEALAREVLGALGRAQAALEGAGDRAPAGSPPAWGGAVEADAAALAAAARPDGPPGPAAVAAAAPGEAAWDGERPALWLADGGQAGT